MTSRDEGRAGAAWIWASTAALAAASAYAVVQDGSLADGKNLALLCLAVAGVCCLAGWWAERSLAPDYGDAEGEGRERLEAELREEREAALEARNREEELRREGRKLARRLEERAEDLRRERFLRHQARESLRAAQSWGRDLQKEVSRLYDELGNLGDPKGVPSMVLRLACNLLDAEKALLLTRPEKGEKLGLAASEGFEADPRDSVLARRFAEEVVGQDRAVRETNPEHLADETATAADREIENLVAVPIYLRDAFSGVVVCANNPDGFEGFDDEVLVSVGDQAGAVLENARLRGEQRDAYVATVRMLAEALEAKDPFMRGHAEDIAGRAAAVADRLGLEPAVRERVVFGALLRDVGKIGISERILLEPGPLTPEERSVVELHPRIGCRLLEQVPALEPVSKPVLHHHERQDGSGYPSGHSGEDILVESRVIFVADAYAAMTGERPYRERVSADEACMEIERHAGTQFYPEVALAFVEEIRRSPAPTERNALNDPALQLGRRTGEPLLGHDPTPDVTRDPDPRRPPER